jgi:hypothetical protein
LFEFKCRVCRVLGIDTTMVRVHFCGTARLRRVLALEAEQAESRLYTVVHLRHCPGMAVDGVQLLSLLGSLRTLVRPPVKAVMSEIERGET